MPLLQAELLAMLQEELQMDSIHTAQIAIINPSSSEVARLPTESMIEESKPWLNASLAFWSLIPFPNEK